MLKSDLELPAHTPRVKSTRRLKPTRKKLVIVGDGCIGKTTLINYFTSKKFQSEHIPTVFENVAIDLVVDNTPYSLTVWDTSGQDDYARLRPLSYPDTDVFLVCFSFDRMDSLENVKDKWLHEIMHYCGKVPILLLGLKMDLKRGDFSGIELYRTGMVDGYMECSAKEGWKVESVFENAVRLAIEREERGSSKKACLLM